MYVITNLNLRENAVCILSMHNLLTDAIEDLHNFVSDYKAMEETYDVLVMSGKRIEIILRDPGWITTGKELIEVFQIIEHSGTYTEADSVEKILTEE